MDLTLWEQVPPPSPAFRRLWLYGWSVPSVYVCVYVVCPHNRSTTNQTTASKYGTETDLGLHICHCYLGLKTHGQKWHLKCLNQFNSAVTTLVQTGLSNSIKKGLGEVLSDKWPSSRTWPPRTARLNICAGLHANSMENQALLRFGRLRHISYC